MDRRGFLKALMAAAVAPTLGRVYSFPTNIDIQPRIIRAKLADRDKLGLTPVIPPRTVTYMFGRDAVFVANLNNLDVPQYTEKEQVITAFHPGVRRIDMFDGPSIADPGYIALSTEWISSLKAVSRPNMDVINNARRLCPPAISPVTSI